MKKNSLKRVAAGALAVISLSTYSLPANVGILSNRPTLFVSATGTQNSIHVYGTIRNLTGAELVFTYVPQSNSRTTSVKKLANNETWSCNGDITMITCAEKLSFPKEWNYDHPKNESIPHVEDITVEEETEDGFAYTFDSPKGNAYAYENRYYTDMTEAVFTNICTCTSNGADTHTLRDGVTVEEHAIDHSTITVASKGDYYFEETASGVGCWKSNNKGYNNTSAVTTWNIEVPQGETLYLNYWATCEANNDHLTIELDKTKPVNKASDQSAGVILIGEGTHTVTATYYKSDAHHQNLDTAYIQFSKYCQKCGYTNARVFMHVENDITGGVAVEGGSDVSLPVYSPMGQAFWCSSSYTVYSNDPLFSTDNGDCFDDETEVGNFKYNKKNYLYKYTIDIPEAQEGHFIYAVNDGYDEDNEWFSAELKEGTAYSGSKLTADDFEITALPELSEEDAAYFNEILNSEETVKSIYVNFGDATTASDQSVYVIIYNPELGILPYHCEFTLPARQITAENLAAAGDIVAITDGAVDPADYVKVSVKGGNGEELALKKGTDYTVTSGTADKAGEYTVKFEGINNCAGEAEITVNVVNAADLTKIAAKEATCLDGNTEYYTGKDGKFYLPAEGYTNVYNEINAEDTVIAADKAHTYSAPAWTWINTGSGYSASAKLICGICGASESYDAVVESSETEDTVIYTASFTADNGTVYTDTKSVAKSFTFTVNGGTVVNGAKESYSYGEAVSVKAEDKDAETGNFFSGWYFNGSLVSTKKEYTFFATCNAEVTAKYDIPAENEAEAAALATLADISMIIERTELSDGTERQNAKFIVNWSLPENCTLKKAGILRAYTTGDDRLADSDLTLEKADGTVIKNNESSLTTQNGTFVYDFNMKAATKVKTINAVAYIVIENADGEELVIYTNAVASVYAE